ncbi:MAG: dephospho-CoA kinase, partial [Actinobacteria bacterium]|nr:dephospho-CoA kinase [Actinomycetota bacterium]
MLVAGLTGGIGSGKSTFAQMLADRGAEVIDADAIGRQALEPGEPAWHSVVDQFGDDILSAGSMTVDRKRLASIVFRDPRKLAALNAIVHPVITHRIADTLEALNGTDEIVILDAALIIELGIQEGLNALIVVAAEEDVRRTRLRKERGMTGAQISERMGAQRPQSELVAVADIIVSNDGSLDRLRAEADRVWADLQERAA